MKKLILIFLSLFGLYQAMAQEHSEKKLTSQIKDVTVFLDNAQIHRVKNVIVPKGESTFRFTGLSPFINPESIKVKTSGNLHLQSVHLEPDAEKGSHNSLSDIVVKVLSDSAYIPTFELSYKVSHAGWFPTYDIRFDNTNQPLQLTYKANVWQATHVDWHNVKLQFSTKMTLTSNNFSKQLIALKHIKKVRGLVTELGTKNPLPGVNINIKGTSVSANTDFDGIFQLNLPDYNHNILKFDYAGYKTLVMPIWDSIVDIALPIDENEVDMFIIMSALSGSNLKKKHNLPTDKKTFNTIPLQKVQTNKEMGAFPQHLFKINQPYFITSGSQTKVIPITNYVIPVNYKYIAIPSSINHVFLYANIKEWKKYHLIPGLAEIMNMNNSAGKIYLDMNPNKDVLQIPLRIDKDIQMDIKLIRASGLINFFKGKHAKKYKLQYTFKNNKAQEINIEIHVTKPQNNKGKEHLQKLTGGHYTIIKDMALWQLHLGAGQSKSIIIN